MQSCITKRVAGTSAVGRCSGHLSSGISRRRFHVRAYDVEVESDPARAPNSGPGRWGAGPPPPPPPPPPPQTTGGMPSRREALFGLLGAGLGVAFTSLYYQKQFDISEETAEKALDALLEDDDFVNAIAEEVLFNEFDANLDADNEKLDELRNELLTRSIDGSNSQQP